MIQQSLVGQGLVIVEASRSHSDTLQSVGFLLTSDQPDAENSDNIYHSQETDIHSPSGIRTHSPSKREATVPCFKLRGQWDLH